MDARDKAAAFLTFAGLCVAVSALIVRYGPSAAGLILGPLLVVAGVLVGLGIVEHTAAGEVADSLPPYVLGLQNEYRSYMAKGELDRAQAVVDELRRFGVTPDGDE